MARKPQTKTRRHAGATLSVLLALTFVSLAFAPVTQPARAETDWQTVAKGGIVGAGSGALIGGLIADGPGAMAGAAVGGIWGAIAGWFAQDKGNAAIAGAKTAYADSILQTTDNYLTLAHTAALNDIANYEALSLYYARKAEWAALQLYQEQAAAGTSFTYDPYKVLSLGEVSNGTLAIIWKIATQYETILNSNANLASSFVGTYDGMSWGYLQPSDYKAGSTISINNPMISKVVFEIGGSKSASANPSYVTLSAGTPIYFACTTSSGGTGTYSPIVINRAGETLPVGNFTCGNYRTGIYYVPVSGEYKVSSGNSAYSAFSLCGPALSSSASLTPVIMPFSEGADGILNFQHSGQYYNWYYIVMSDMSDTSNRVDVRRISDDLNAMKTKVATMLAQANGFAQAYYNTLVSSGGGENRVMPDIVFPDPEALANLTPEQIQAIYLAYLNQMQNWFQNYSVQDPSSVNLSAESLHLKVRGSIYYANGTLAYSNTTIFTPYVSIANMHLALGNNTMTQAGFAIRWGNASSISALQHNITDVTYISLAVGDYMIIEEMLLDGEPVTETDLTVHTIQYIVSGELPRTDPPQGLTDLEFLLNHWYWFAVIAGAIMLLAWIPTRNTAVGVIGLVCLAAGLGFWLYADWKDSGGLLSGLFDSIRGRL